MIGFISPRAWPATSTLRSVDWINPMLDRHSDKLQRFIAGTGDRLQLDELGAVATRLPDDRLPAGQYFGLHIAERLLPCRLKPDGQVTAGFAGESTNTAFDLISGLLSATDGKLDGPDAVAFATRAYREMNHATVEAQLESVATCPVCTDQPTHAPAPIVQCRSCEAVHRPDANDAHWRSHYADASGRYFNGISATDVNGAHGYEDYEEWARVILGRQHFDTRVRWIEAVTGQHCGRALDVGCATGEMAASLARHGWQATGTDLSQYCVNRAVELHPDCRFTCATLEECGFDWDLVTYLDVFEHLADPHSELHNVRQRLKPHGWLVLELPNQASAEAQILGPDYLFSEHQYFFGPRAIGVLLARTGFRVEAIATSHDAYFRVDRITGPALAAELISQHRGERLLVAAQPIR